MRIKKFTGKTFKEISDLMKTDLGEGAIILHSKSIKDELNTEEELLEITAAIDDDAPKLLSLKGLPPNQPGQEINPLENLRQIAARFEKSREFQKTPESTEKKETKENYEINNFRSDLDSVKGALGEIAHQLKTVKIPTLPKNLQSAYEILISNEVDPTIATDIILEIFNKLSADQLEDLTLIHNFVVSKISELLKTAEPLQANEKQSKIIVFVGPTGVGKTTTICKIAAVCKFFNKYNVAILTSDTYRIAAIEQLHTFTTIANIPLEVAYTPMELVDYISKHKDKDVLFIDTVGRSPKNTEQIKELEKYINAVSPDEVHLIISSNTSFSNIKEIIKDFGILKPNRLLFSKIDETTLFGNILNTVYHSKIPLSYVTNGQNTPDDINVADSMKLAQMIYQENINLFRNE